MRCSAAFTLVELLVVMLIVAIFVFFAGPAWVRSTRLERNLRDEGYARTRLVLDMERITRELSLANGIAWEDPVSRQVVSNTAFLSHPATNYIVHLSYPEETGGVSFETNRIARVSSVRLSLAPGFLVSSASNHVDLAPAEQRRSMGADPVFVGAKQGADFTGICITNVVSSGGVVQADLLHVTLSSVIHLDAGQGETYPKTISVDRLVRMWNR